MVLEPQALVAARLYPSQDAVIEDALRSLLLRKKSPPSNACLR